MKIISFRKFIKNQGFSLIEITLGIAIVGIVGVLVSKLSVGLFKTENRNNYLTTVNQISSQLQSTISNRYSCTMTLQGLSVSEDIPAIKFGEPAPDNSNNAVAPTDPRKPKILFENGKEFKNTGVMVKSIKLFNRASQDLIQVTFESAAASRLATNTSVVKDYLVFGSKINGKYVNCYADGIDSLEETLKEACKALNGAWVNGQCELKNLPRCIIAQSNSCLLGGTFGYREIDKVRLGKSPTELVELIKCCREDVATTPWPTMSPTSSCVDSPLSHECQECVNPGPNSAICPTCGPSDGLPYWEFKGWSPCINNSQESEYQCVPGASVPGISCLTACGSEPSASQSCEIKLPDGKDCNVQGQLANWDSCSGSYPGNLLNGESAKLSNSNDGFKGSVKGTCTDGNIILSEGKCDACKACAGHCVVPASHTWGNCAGVKDVATGSIPNNTYAYYQNKNNGFDGGSIARCKDGTLSWSDKCGKTCDFGGGNLSWGAGCGAIKGAEKITDGLWMDVYSTVDGFDGKQRHTCKDGSITITSQTCGAAQVCKISGAFKWGSGCSGTLPSTKIYEGDYEFIDNSAPGLYGFMKYVCKDGVLTNAFELCEEEKPCDFPGGDKSWGVDSKCHGSAKAQKMKHKDIIGITSTTDGWGGTLYITCKNGVIGESIFTCNCITSP